MAIYSTLYGLPQSMVDYLNQPLPSIQQPYRPGYDKNYGPKEGMGYTTVMPQPGYQYVYGPDGQRYSIPIPGYDPNENADIGDPQGIVSLYPEVAASGDGFSPYDIRPGDSSIRTPDQYSPYAYNQAMRIGQTVGPNPDLYYAPPTGIEQLLSKIPTFGGIKKGLDALADKLPVNRTAIFQNELLGQGIKLDNIGRIVTDNYRTPEGIMAGYNPVSGGLLNMLTGGAYGEPTTYGLEKSVEKRQENIRNTLQDKYKLSNEQIDDVIAEIEETGTYTGPFGFNQTMGKTTNLFTDLFNLGVFNQKQLDAKKKADIIFEQKLKEKRQSDPAFIEQQKIEKAAKTRRDFQGLELTGIRTAEAARASAAAQEAANREAARQAGAARASVVAQESSNREAARQAGAARASVVAQESSNREAARQAGAARASAVAQEKANRDAARSSVESRGGGASYGTRSESGFRNSPF
jgi:hypothetical protein